LEEELDLTKEEHDTLKRHGYSAADVFDGRSYRTIDWQAIVKNSGKRVIVRSSKCKKGGHRLVDPDNHCLACAPASQGFRNRHYEDGDVYVLGSLSKKLIKVGFSADFDTRHESIVRQSYGGAIDWVLLLKIRFQNGGNVEAEVKSALRSWRVDNRDYVKDGKLQKASEIFACSFSRAADQLLKNPNRHLSKPWFSEIARQYEFEKN
jgi:hypothetical protein